MDATLQKTLGDLSIELKTLFEQQKKEHEKRIEVVEKWVNDPIRVQLEANVKDLEGQIQSLEEKYRQAVVDAKKPDKNTDEETKQQARDAWNTRLRLEGLDQKGNVTQEMKDLLTKSMPEEVKAYLSNTATQGQEWAPTEFVNELQRDVTEISPVRQVARIRTTTRQTVDIPTHTGAGAATRAAEAGARNAVSEATTAIVQISPTELQVRYDASRESLLDVAFDLAAEIRQDAAEQIAKKEGNDFIKGTGAGANPQGFLANVGSTVDIGAAITAANFVSCYFLLKTAYASNAVWMMARGTIEDARLLADSNGRYMWDFQTPGAGGGLTQGVPGTILGRPVYEAVDMDAVGADNSTNRPVAFGDFRRGYTIVDRVGVRTLVDPYSDGGTGMIRYYTYINNSGGVVKAEALAAMVQ